MSSAAFALIFFDRVVEASSDRSVSAGSSVRLACRAVPATVRTADPGTVVTAGLTRLVPLVGWPAEDTSGSAVSTPR